MDSPSQPSHSPIHSTAALLSLLQQHVPQMPTGMQAMDAIASPAEPQEMCRASGGSGDISHGTSALEATPLEPKNL